MNSPEVTATFCATLLDEWVALGVRRAVIAPGSRSTPMALAIAANPTVSVEVFHDERSASFAALGMAKSSGVPTVLLCTSGTAAANFHPAVAEASHAEVPLIVLTADRPPELQGIGAAQTIDQRNLYGSAVRSFVDVGVPDDDDRAGWRRIARRLHAMSTGDRPGPVHMNLPFREPLLGVSGSLPERGDEPGRRNHKPVGTETLSRLVARLGNRRGVIVAGARGPTPNHLLALARRLQWPVLADPLGGCRGDSALAVRHADAWLRDPDLATRFVPEVVLRFGSVPASKVVNSWLRDSAAELTVVSDSSFLIDPDRRSSMHVVADPDVLCTDLSPVVAPVDRSWSTLWETAEESARVAVAGLLDDEPRLSEPGAARTTVRELPEGSSLVVSSSMPIRDVEWYSASSAHLTVLANRGVNGIDGVVSTAVGVALSHGGPTGLLIGDVAFLHDSNGLIGLMDRRADVRIVVVDNHGGGIFSFLPQRSSLGVERFEQLFGTPHTSDVEKLAGAHGVPAVSVVSTRDLAEALALPGPRVIVVRSDRQENVAVHDAVHAAVQGALR
jgi:2-succinyl-5-enolpyruvyl-6-hydroxy-3-cyclohexene-1-carboxylate synthase